MLLGSCTKDPVSPGDSGDPAAGKSAEVGKLRTGAGFVEASSSGLVTLSVGVVPQQAASVLAQKWMPLLKHIGEKANVHLVFKTASNIPIFEERCAAGDYDIAYMNPYHYTVFHEQEGYEAIVKRSGSKIKGILVKKRGSGLQTLKDLEGAHLAFPAPRAFAATLLTSAGLSAAGVEFESNYVSSHDSVYLNVARGRFAAGGGIMRTFNSVSAEVRDQLEILWETPEYTPHAFAVHPRVDSESKESVTRALIAMGNYDAGRALLSPLKIKMLEAAADEDWDDVRGLQIRVR
jgi:phosphonate transport system substrate-binding protein